MKIAIIQFPGTSGIDEIARAILRADMEPVSFFWHDSEEKLRTYDGFVIASGELYNGIERPGIIAALTPIIGALKELSCQGKPILGIGAGAQVLVEAGLVPGLENDKVGLAITKKNIFWGWIHIRLSSHYQFNAFTKHMTAQTILPVPITSQENCFVLTEALAYELKEQGQLVWQYCDVDGKRNSASDPTASSHQVAAISNKMGNVLAMLPHPERTPYGDAIFLSMCDYIKAGYVTQLTPLNYYPRRAEIRSYPKLEKAYLKKTAREMQQAIVAQTTLRQLGLPVSVNCYQYHEKLIKDGTSLQLQSATSSILYLVCSKEAATNGMLWQFTFELGELDDWLAQLCSTRVLFNQFTHNCYEYAKYCCLIELSFF